MSTIGLTLIVIVGFILMVYFDNLFWEFIDEL